jgi:RES domain-containing protein
VKGLRDPANVVANSALVPWSGRIWRCHHRSRKALNADGSLGGFGGRFNAGVKSVVRPPFRALYTSVESAAALLEVIRHLGFRGPDSRYVVPLDGILMCTLSQLDVVLQRVFDWDANSDLRDLLASNSSQAAYSYTQQLAAAAIASGAEAILVPSATGIDTNLVVFVDNLGEGSHIEVVRQISDLRPFVTLEGES